MTKHGTKYSYDQGCRCGECRQAAVTVRRTFRNRARAARSPAYLRELATSRALKERYRGSCVDCGRPTSWGGGQSSPGPARRCSSCYHAQRPRAEHGSASRYSAGCRCQDCRAAHAAKMRAYTARRREHSAGIPGQRQ